MSLGTLVTTHALLLSLHRRPRLAPVISRLVPGLSLAAWIGLTLLGLSGLLLLASRMELAGEAAFQWKIALVSLIGTNGVALNVWIIPRFQELAGRYYRRDRSVRQLEIIAGTSAGLSIVSWWAVVILGFLLARG